MMAALQRLDMPIGLLVSILAFMVLAGGIFIILRLLFAVLGGLARGLNQLFSDDRTIPGRKVDHDFQQSVNAKCCSNSLCRRSNVPSARFCSHCGARLPFQE